MSAPGELSLSMPLGQVLAERRSVRDFRPDPPSQSQIRALLAAAVCAPCAIRDEPWAFAVVRDKARLRRISDRAKPMFLDDLQRPHVQRTGPGLNLFADPDFNIFYNAPALIIVCGASLAPCIEAECWLAAENLLLAAHAGGLGACVVGSAIAALNLDEIKRELDIPQSYSAVAPIIVGFAADERAGEARAPKVPRILSWH